jgi:hypothetical protein
MIAGGCRCGGVRFEIERAAGRFQLCPCADTNASTARSVARNAAWPFIMTLKMLTLLGCFAVASGSAVAQTCVGDCNDDGSVEINELILGVNIALEALDISACPNLDDGQGAVTVDRLIAAVNSALCDCAGCSTPGPGTATPTATAGPATPTATPTGGVSVSMWRVDDYDVTSSDCAGVIEDAVLSGLQAGGSDFTVRQSGEQIEIVDEEGNVFQGTADPDGTVHVQRSLSDSVATCDYDADVDASANLSQSPTTATYDGAVNLSGFCLGLSDCSLQVTSRWTRLDPS